jgi:hypothetical protein
MIPTLQHLSAEPAAATPHRSHVCDETLKKVLLLLDGQLDDAAQKALTEDINQCHDCLEKWRIEKEYKAFLHARVAKKECTESLKAKIKAIVNEQIIN